ncbi:MAG: hypothetical protein O7C75_19275 [Verrucomicrobia bacterium]|nr:hypothetical protein [Verrucomicrobiota bacterium]
MRITVGLIQKLSILILGMLGCSTLSAEAFEDIMEQRNQLNEEVKFPSGKQVQLANSLVDHCLEVK